MPKIGELPTLWSKVVGIKCPECSRPQPPRKMDSTNPYRGFNRTDFHMCGGCGKYLYLTGKRRILLFFLLRAPTFLGATSLGIWVVGSIEGLNSYHEARDSLGPNFLGVLLIGVAMYVALSLLGRFEDVGIATPFILDDERTGSDN